MVSNMYRISSSLNVTPRTFRNSQTSGSRSGSLNTYAGQSSGRDNRPAGQEMELYHHGHGFNEDFDRGSIGSGSHGRFQPASSPGPGYDSSFARDSRMGTPNSLRMGTPNSLRLSGSGSGSDSYMAASSSRSSSGFGNFGGGFHTLCIISRQHSSGACVIT